MNELMKSVAVRLFSLKSFAKQSYRYAKNDIYIKWITILFSYSMYTFRIRSAQKQAKMKKMQNTSVYTPLPAKTKKPLLFRF